MTSRDRFQRTSLVRDGFAPERRQAKKLAPNIFLRRCRRIERVSNSASTSAAIAWPTWAIHDVCAARSALAGYRLAKHWRPQSTKSSSGIVAPLGNTPGRQRSTCEVPRSDRSRDAPSCRSRWRPGPVVGWRSEWPEFPEWIRSELPEPTVSDVVMRQRRDLNGDCDSNRVCSLPAHWRSREPARDLEGVG